MHITASGQSRHGTNGSARAGFRILIGGAILLISAATASAQTRVKVTQDQTVIWDASFAIVAGTVQAGTELEVVGQRGTWYEVVLPFRSTSGRTTGFVASTKVEVVPGSGPLPAETEGPAARRAPGQTSAQPSAAPGSGARAFVQVGYARFLAEQSFKATLNQYGGVVYGGGAEYHTAGGGFIQIAAEQLKETGERVFVSNGNVFKLGIPDTITVIPLTVTAGYRSQRNGIAPYLGGGIGRYFFREESEFADPSENVKEQYTGYHVLGGIETSGSWFGAAFEVEYSHVPKAFTGGTAAAFDEHNLGAVRVRVKVLFGSAR